MRGGYGNGREGMLKCEGVITVPSSSSSKRINFIMSAQISAMISCGGHERVPGKGGRCVDLCVRVFVCKCQGVKRGWSGVWGCEGRLEYFTVTTDKIFRRRFQLHVHPSFPDILQGRVDHLKRVKGELTPW